MARHKKIETEEQSDPEMNISSMIDCCFLLLIYFLVATSLVSEKKLDFSVPASGEASASDKKPDVRNIRIDAQGQVSCEQDNNIQVGPLDLKIQPGDSGYMEQRHLTSLAEALKSYNDAQKSVGEEPVVTVSADPLTKNQRIIDVMAALAEAGITTVRIEVQE